MAAGDIGLYYARDEDRRLIYDMAHEDPDVIGAMYDDPAKFPWSQLRDELAHFFGDEPGMSKYLLIAYEGRWVGAISHTYHDGKIPSFEIDIWLRHIRYTGRGIGSAAMQLLIDYLAATYDAKTFIIRPSKHNKRAVRAYEKCGFKRVDNFDPAQYYGFYLATDGDGDYGPEETANMILTL